MADDVQIVSFAGGELRVPPKLKNGGEAVLALPLSRLLAKVVRLPAAPDASAAEGGEGAAAASVDEELKRMSPFPDEPLAVSVELLREDAGGSVALAAALPESSADDMAEALDAAKVNVTRVDALVLGFARSAWNEIAPEGGGRWMLLYAEEDCTSLVVFDGEAPCAVRALSPGCDMARETMLSLMEAEEFAGPAPLASIVAAGEVTVDGLGVFGAAVRTVDASRFDALAGVAERTGEEGTLNALPDSWREVLLETRFKRKMKIGLGAAAAVWIAALVGVVGYPMYLDRATKGVETQRQSHRGAYRRVSEKKAQVEAVRSVSNHDLGALETLRVVASALPEGVELSKWNFKRGERLTFDGTAEDDDGTQRRVYAFKDALAAVALSEVSGDEGDAETQFFSDVVLPKGVVKRSGKAAFSVECRFDSEGEDE